jgi:NitT/TauT family transport system permease protein
MKRFHLGWFAPFFALAVWMIVSRFYPAYAFPRPLDVWDEAVKQWQNGAIFGHIAVSLRRLAIGFLSSAVSAFVIGIFAGISSRFREFLTPLVTYFQATPPMAWAPFLIVILGLGDLPMIAVIIIATFFPILINVIQGMNLISENHLRAARSLGAKGWKMAIFVYLPEIIPSAISGLYVGFAIGWRSLVAAEMIGGNAGIGFFIASNGQTGNIPAVLLGVLLIGFLALGLDFLFLKPLHRRLGSWKG